MKYTKNIYPKYKIGDYTYGSPIIIDRWGGQLEIGKYCSIAHNVVIMLGGNHNSDWITTYPFPVLYNENKDLEHPIKEGKTKIGNDVWIGMDSFILPGVSIGDGSVIGARTVVSNDVDPYSIFVGNPGRCVRKRFDEETIYKLMKIQWWNWDCEKIRNNVRLLCSKNIMGFINANL